MKKTLVTSGALILIVLFIFLPAMAQEKEQACQPEKVLKEFSFDKLRFKQADKELFTHEEVEVCFPVTLQLIEAYDKENDKKVTFFWFNQEQIQENNIIFSFRVFPGALIEFKPLSDYDRAVQELRSGKRSEFTTWGIYDFSPYSLLSNASDVNSESIWLDKFAVVCKHPVTDDKSYNQLKGWYSTLEKAIEQKKPVIISLKVMQVYIDYAGYDLDLSDYLKPNPPGFIDQDYLVIHGQIMEIKIDKK